MQLEAATVQTAPRPPAPLAVGRKDTAIRQEATFIPVTCETLSKLLNAAALAIKRATRLNGPCVLT